MTITRYILRPATAQEVDYIHVLNAESWAGDLDADTYRLRERLLASAPLTACGGISCWVLVDLHVDSEEILSSCEMIRKDAFLTKPSPAGEALYQVHDVISQGVGSVFTPVEHRGRGYASLMLRLLADMLVREDPGTFNVLYSDIGKKFYARLGWIPHRSSHIEFPAMDLTERVGVRYLRASQVPALCERDAVALRNQMSLPSDGRPKARVAFRPDFRTMEWNWTREEFMAPILRPHILKKPERKGAITADGRRWVLWNRDCSLKTPQLYIIRLVNLRNKGEPDSEVEKDVELLLRAAAQEAKIWELQRVTLWNPDELTIRVARKIAGSNANLVDREMGPICSLMMHDQESEEKDVEWMANEKFAWC